MAVFKFVISEPKSRKSFQMEVDQSKAIGLIGKKIGDEFNGDVIGLSGYVLKITGGTDKDGFPMHPSLKGTGRKKLLLSSPPGFHPLKKGQRKRKTVRGDTISEDIVQINVKVVKVGEKPFDQLTPKKVAKETAATKKEDAVTKKEEKKPVEKEPEKEKKAEIPEKPVEIKKESEDVKEEQPKESVDKEKEVGEQKEKEDVKEQEPQETKIEESKNEQKGGDEGNTEKTD